MKSEYTIYKGEKILGTGTAEELSKILGIKRSSIYFYNSPAHKKRDKGNLMVAVKVN